MRPASLVGSLVLFAAGGGVSWAMLSAKAEAAQQSAASANAAVQRLSEAMGKRVDALEASTSSRLSALETEQRHVRESQIRMEERLGAVDVRSAQMDRRLEVLLDRTNPKSHPLR